jgi:ceramide glucosyltransferase
VVDECSLDDLVRHELRWLRTIRAVRPLGYACCFFTFGLAPAALGTLLAVGAWPSLAMLTVTAVARLLIHCSARGARSTLLQFWVVPLTDLLNFTLWCRGFLARRVQWRHARYRIARDGSAHAIP